MNSRVLLELSDVKKFNQFHEKMRLNDTSGNRLKIQLSYFKNIITINRFSSSETGEPARRIYSRDRVNFAGKALQEIGAMNRLNRFGK